MLNSPKRAAQLIVLILSGLLPTGLAFAHSPMIDAQAVCDLETGLTVIEYTSVSFDVGTLAGENPQIDILVNGVVADTGAYEPPDWAFSGVLPAPMGTQPGDGIIIAAVAVGDWGNGTPGGQSEAHIIYAPDDDCAPDVANGRFTGGGHQIRVDGVRVTRGLTIHCDLLLSNNLEINWNGNSFHTTEHLSTIQCSDDPDIIQAPPPAPLDTLIGTGTGRFNGDDGYSIEFTLVDQGEPGREDEAAFLIYETGNPANVVLEVPLQQLSGGNLQAHYDQPHR